MPLLIAIPFLFAAGVLFGYFVVLPAAVRFFVNFNSSEFNVLVQASQFYSFAATILLAMGLIFQVPVAILGGDARRARDRRPAAPQPPLRDRRVRGRRRVPARATLVTLALETVPLYLLYEASILVATLVDRSSRRSYDAASAGDGADGALRREPAPPPRRRSGANRAGDNRPRRPRALGLMLFDLRGRGRRTHGPRRSTSGSPC